MAFQSVIFALASLSAVGLVTANLQSIPRGVLQRSTAESCFLFHAVRSTLTCGRQKRHTIRSQELLIINMS